MKKFYLLSVFCFLKDFVNIKAFTINCDYNFNHNWVVIGSLYTCDATNISTSSGIIITEVLGTHLSNNTNNDVKVVDISGNQTLSFFPRNLIYFFPNLIGVRIRYATFEVLYGDELEEFGEKFKWIVIVFSKLITISSRLFERTPNIVYTNFNYNLIDRVGNDLFTPLNKTQMEYVGFLENKCIDQIASNQAAIITLINDLQIKCPFDDENYLTTTTSNTESITTTIDETTSEISACFEGKVDDFVCELNERFLNDVEAKDKRIEELELKNEKILEELEWIKIELLRLTTNPCTCK